MSNNNDDNDGDNSNEDNVLQALGAVRGKGPDCLGRVAHFHLSLLISSRDSGRLPGAFGGGPGCEVHPSEVSSFQLPSF